VSIVFESGLESQLRFISKLGLLSVQPSMDSVRSVGPKRRVGLNAVPTVEPEPQHTHEL